MASAFPCAPDGVIPSSLDRLGWPFSHKWPLILPDGYNLVLMFWPTALLAISSAIYPGTGAWLQSTWSGVFAQFDTWMLIKLSYVAFVGLFWLLGAPLTLLGAVQKWRWQSSTALPWRTLGPKLLAHLAVGAMNWPVFGVALLWLAGVDLAALDAWAANLVDTDALGLLRRVLTVVEPLPTPLILVRDTVVFFVMYEIVFYHVHRALHHPKLYQRFHATHHEWTSPIAIEASYSTVVEQTMTAGLPFALTLVLITPHIVTLWLMIVQGLIHTLVTHAGIAWPLGGLLRERFHDLHHEKWSVNYGILGIFDRAYGTYYMEPSPAPKVVAEA